jgi:hypothetical protein
MVSSRESKAEKAAENSSRAKKRPDPTAQQKREDALRPIGGTYTCWCGKKFGHAWRGKAQGKPHPRARRR